MSFETQQEEFWSGTFGDDYIDRNRFEDILPAKKALFEKVLAHVGASNSFIELGANIGTNLAAIHELKPDAELKALEINQKAVEVLNSYDWLAQVIHGSLLEENLVQVADFSFTAGVLIHINPDHLKKAYGALYNASREYVMVCEYYNPSPVEIAYRGHEEKLFKRDFAGEMMDIYPDLKLVEYGFIYHRDPHFPMDDMTWFLMKKT